MPSFDRQKWDEKYSQSPGSCLPEEFLIHCAPEFPARGKGLDIAGGNGRNSLYLARLGWDMTLLDISGVGINLARHNATEQGLRLSTQILDLEESPLPSGPWDLIISTHYLLRPLFKDFSRLLTPGGQLLFIQPTETNLDKNPKPSREYLLGRNELPRLIKDLKIELYEEGWFAGRHLARLLAQKNS